MSLTRQQWLTIWNHLVYLDLAVHEAIPPHSGYRQDAKRRIRQLKTLIQAVIGQMEPRP